MGVEMRAAVDTAKLSKPGTRQGSGSGPAPPAPPTGSVTRREIDKFWRKRRSVEEEHFLAAIKAAARLRASRLSEEDYLVFLEENKIEEEDVNANANYKSTENKGQEIRVGIKDWWTKSKYAYLNEPATGSTGGRLGRVSQRWNYIPNKVWYCNYKYAAPLTVSAKLDEAQPPPPCLRVF